LILSTIPEKTSPFYLVKCRYHASDRSCIASAKSGCIFNSQSFGRTTTYGPKFQTKNIAKLLKIYNVCVDICFKLFSSCLHDLKLDSRLRHKLLLLVNKSKLWVKKVVRVIRHKVDEIYIAKHINSYSLCTLFLIAYIWNYSELGI